VKDFSFYSHNNILYKVENARFDFSLKNDDLKKFLNDPTKMFGKPEPLTVMTGDWDTYIFDFTKLLTTGLHPMYNAMDQYFNHGAHWIETELFRYHYRYLLKSGSMVKKCSNMGDLSEYYTRSYEKIYNDFSNNRVDKNKPIEVYIGRNGEVIFTKNGNHRLCIAMLLNMDTIPFIITGIHDQLVRYEK
jgi:hypothetical protein